MSDGRPRGDSVQSLARGLAVIRAFGAETPQLTLSEVAAATGLTRAAARRFLLTLVDLDYVRVDGRLFSLRPRVLELGYAYLSSLSLADVAQPHLEELVARIHESSSVAVLDDEDVVYVARIATKRIMNVVIAVGTRFPAYATSMGRVLLAGLPPRELDAYLATVKLEALTPRTVLEPERLREILAATRRAGYTMTDQELEEGLRSAAAPIRDPAGNVIAAVNASAQAPRVSMQTLRADILPHVIATARRIEADLAARGGRGRGR